MFGLLRSAPALIALAASALFGCDGDMMGSGHGGGMMDSGGSSPSDFTPDFGTAVRTISTDTTISVGESNTLTTVVAGATAILSDDGATPATGLHVMSGATLTLDPWCDSDNRDGDFDARTGSMELVSMYFSAGAYIEGSIVIGRRDAGETTGSGGSRHSGDCRILASDIVVTPTGRIVAEGEDSPNEGDGGEGGDLDLIAAGGRVRLDGPLSCRGGSATTGKGGDGGRAYAYGWNCHTMGMTADGGGSESGAGGNGGSLEVASTASTSLAGGVMSVRRGRGISDGSDGTIVMDGVQASITDGMMAGGMTSGGMMGGGGGSTCCH